MKHTTAFLAGATATLIVGALGYYACEAFNSYVDARARAAIMYYLKDLPVDTNVNPPSRQNS